MLTGPRQPSRAGGGEILFLAVVAVLALIGAATVAAGILIGLGAM